MKKALTLRLKLTMATVAVLVLALAVCYVLITGATRRILKNVAIADTAAEALRLTAQFRENFEAVGSSASDAIARYLFISLAVQTPTGSSYVLEADGQGLFNNSGLSPAALLDRKSESVTLEQQEFRAGFQETAGRHYCVVGAAMGSDRLVSVVRDVTAQMEQVSLLRRRCIAVGTAAAVAAGGLMLLFLTMELRPLRDLQQSSAAIAGGDYGRRVQCGRQDELGLVAQSFNTMAQSVQAHIDAVEAASREQNLLLHALSHEMRTPVTAISGYAYALTHLRMNETQRVEATAFLESESRRLERLYTKLTELLTVTDAQIGLTPLRPEALQGQLLSLLLPAAKKQGIALEIQLGSNTILGDADLLTMLVTNLYDNARKAGATHFRVVLEGGTLTVSDDGCGIPKEIQDKIMQPFFQGDSSRSHEGFGLGLTLCSRVAHLHGSALQVRSETGKGTTFTTLLQLHDDSQTAPAVQSSHHRKE